MASVLASVSCGQRTDATGPSAITPIPSAPTKPAPQLPSALVFTVQPLATLAGATISPPVQVAVRDSLGGTVSTSPISVTIALAPGATGALHGTLTAMAVNGVATFSDLSPTDSGHVRLVATATGLRADTSASFAVSSTNVLDRIAFVQSNSGGPGNLSSSVVVMNADGSGVRTIFSGGSLEHPRWSPDGLKLVFSGQSIAPPPNFMCWWYDVTCQSKILLANADGSGGLTYLTAGLAWHSADPAWAPNGGKIAFTYLFDGIDDAYSIDMMNPDGSGVVRLAYPINWETDLYMAPTWSPDSRSLAFQFLSYASTGPSTMQILIADLTGSIRTLIPAFPVTFRWSASGTYGPEWSPDGSRVLFRNDSGLAVAPVDGSKIIQLTSDATDGMASWTPQGRILFTRVVGGVSRIHLMNADGGNVTVLPQPQGNNYWPSWSPRR